MDYSFPQTQHLKNGSEFALVIKQGKIFKLENAKLYGVSSTDAHSKLGFIVGKKSGNAPQRNHIKRLWKEAFRIERAHFSEPLDVVIKVFPGFKSPDLEQLKLHIRQLYQCCVGLSSL